MTHLLDPDQFSDSSYDTALASLFSVFEDLCEGAVTVDLDAKIVWMSDKYKRLLSLPESMNVVGMGIEELIPNSLMRKVIETNTPILLDVMHFGHQTFVVTRVPLNDEKGKVIGAVGFVLYDRLNYLEPLVRKVDSLRRKVDKANTELAKHRRSKYTFHQIIGSSPEMQTLKKNARRAATRDATVIIRGETGTGKELLAQSIHAASDRAQGPFIGVNVAAIPDELLEAEFFGVSPGAYTGATKEGRKGKLEIANGGTLFLDEIGDMPQRLQSKLLRVLQEREMERLGSNELIPIDVRIIAATSRDIEAMVEDGSFRSDLYFRLNVMPFEVPPLRKRKIDIPGLSEVLLEQIAVQNGDRLRELTPSVFKQFASYDWPGNVRELRNVLERATTLTDRHRLSDRDFSQILPSHSSSASDEVPVIQSLDERIELVEREAIVEALELTQGKRAPAAKLLGISRARLYDKLKKYDLVSE